MPQPRSPQVDWLLEAWNLATAIAAVPARPLKLGSLGRLPLDESVESYLAGLQTRLNQFLNYCVAKKLGAGKAKTLAIFDGGDSRHLIATRNALKAAGMDFDERATAAIFVHAQIGIVRRDCYLDEPSRSTLPVTLAAIAGKSAGLQNAVAASQPRMRRQDLRAAKREALAKNDALTWKELLYDLQGDGIVSYWDDTVIRWIDEQDNERTTKPSTFRGWKS